MGLNLGLVLQPKGLLAVGLNLGLVLQPSAGCGFKSRACT